VELGLQAQLVKKHGHEVPKLLDLLRRQSVGPDAARLTFSTAHRAKGLEWDCVRLLDDFVNPADTELLDSLEPRVRDEEINILYVAMTRARLKLKYPAKLLDWLQAHGDSRRDTSHWFLSAGSATVAGKPAKKVERRVVGAGKARPGDLAGIAARVAALPLIKDSASLHPNLRDARRQYPRAYEPWSAEEDELLKTAREHTNDPVRLARVFGRNIGGLTRRLDELGLD